MKISLILPFVIAGFFLMSPSAGAQSTTSAVDDSIHSEILKENRELRVVLPKDYQAGSLYRYEVVYVLDGEWYQELIPFIYNFGEFAGYFPKSIFVFVHNRYSAGRNLRDRDFSPTKVATNPFSGGADRFYGFLTREVVPYIENKYPASGRRSLLGSSFSGLFAVYAFLKAPAFFQSFIASDPNLDFDNHYLSKLATRTLPGITGTPGTLFIAGRTNTYSEGGILRFDSVMQVHAPAILKWQCARYENETHYSVQLKAFYDGLRFSHYGYSSKPPEFHPMNGMVLKNKSFSIYSLNDNLSARFTTDGSQPTIKSPVMPRDTSFVVTAPASIHVKAFANRSSYIKNWTAIYSTGQLFPDQSRKTAKGELNYKIFDGSWDAFPQTTTLTPALSGAADSLVKLAALMQQRAGFLTITGTIDVMEDSEYVFYANGFDAVRLSVGGKVLCQEDIHGNPASSYIISLKKGRYSLRLELLHKTASLEPHFSMSRSRSDNLHWWENRILDF